MTLTRRPRTGCILGLWLAIVGSTSANSPLPFGFGPVKIGTPWAEVEHTLNYKDLTDESTVPERLGLICGYRTIAVTTDEGDLLITTHDHIITELAYITKFQPETNVSAVADLVMKTYGPPRTAIMRNALGQATINQSEVAHIELNYESEHPVTFFVSGPSIWQYQVTVQFNRARWHENKNNRCARNKEKKQRSNASTNVTGN